MGIYLNPGNAAFSEAVHSQIYVDKTELISYTNKGRSYPHEVTLLII